MNDFFEVFGHRAEGVWQAPGRVNIIGEFTDYNGGLVLPMALDRTTRASVARRHDDVVRVASAAPLAADRPLVTRSLGSLVPEPGDWADHALGVIWALRQAGCALAGVDVLVESTVPIGAGLSSSAALQCAVGLALRDLFAPELTRPRLAELCRRAENEFVGVPSGVMDQMASLCCVAGHALLLDSRSGKAEQLDLRLAEHGLTFLVLDTGSRRSLAASAYADRRAACEAASHLLGLSTLRGATAARVERLPAGELRQRARHVITENGRVLDVARLVRAGRIEEIGPALSASHRSLRDDFDASSPALDLAVAAAEAAGALGARMTGGGFGGCAIALVRGIDAGQVAASVARALVAAGHRAPESFRAVPSDGARRVA